MRKILKKCIAFVLSSVLVISGLLAGGFGSIHAKAAEPNVTIQDILPADFPDSINSTWKNESDKKVFANNGYLRFYGEDDLSIPLNSVIDTSNNRYIVNFTTSSGNVVQLGVNMEYGSLYSLYFEPGYPQYSSYQGEYRIRKSISDILPDASVLPWYDAAIFTTESGDAYIYYDSASNNLKVCSKDKQNIGVISCNEKVIRNYLGDYECAFDEGLGNDVKLDFYVIENKVASIKLHYQGSHDGYIDAFRGTYAKRKTIAEILPEDFPVDFTTNQWANQNGHTIMYSDSNKNSIKFDIGSGNTKYIDVSENVVVSSSSSGVEYFYSDPDSDVTLKFSQPREALECINISGDSVGEEYKGDYVKIKGSYTVTNGTKSDDESTNHGYIAIDKDSAHPDETVTVTVYPSENYRLKSLPKYELSGETYYGSKGANDNEYTFSMPDSDITITAEFESGTTPPEPTPEEENPEHVHNYVWREISAPTIYSDGLEEEVCTVCGDIRNSNSISAMSFAIENYAMSLIQAAKPGQTVTFEFGEWNSFPKEFMAKLVDKSAQNVTFVFKYNWNHKLQTITIPAGTHIDLNFDWYGPAKMAELYGANKR